MRFNIVPFAVSITVNTLQNIGSVRFFKFMIKGNEVFVLASFYILGYS